MIVLNLPWVSYQADFFCNIKVGFHMIVVKVQRTDWTNLVWFLGFVIELPGKGIWRNAQANADNSVMKKKGFFRSNENYFWSTTERLFSFDL